MLPAAAGAQASQHDGFRPPRRQPRAWSPPQVTNRLASWSPRRRPARHHGYRRVVGLGVLTPHPVVAGDRHVPGHRASRRAGALGTQPPYEGGHHVPQVRRRAGNRVELPASTTSQLSSTGASSTGWAPCDPSRPRLVGRGREAHDAAPGRWDRRPPRSGRAGQPATAGTAGQPPAVPGRTISPAPSSTAAGPARSSPESARAWGERRGSNPRQPGPQPGALPAELRPPRRG